jgi:hypothetical protein
MLGANFISPSAFRRTDIAGIARRHKGQHGTASAEPPAAAAAQTQAQAGEAAAAAGAEPPLFLMDLFSAPTLPLP